MSDQSGSAAGEPALFLEIGVGERRLAISIDVVEAVVLTPPITPVPGTPPALAGLFNHHGVVYPAVHPSPDDRSSGRQAILVRTRAYGRLALLCDWAHEIVEAPSSHPIDVERLAADVVAAYDRIDSGPLVAAHPRALVKLRRGRQPRDRA